MKKKEILKRLEMICESSSSVHYANHGYHFTKNLSDLHTEIKESIKDKNKTI